MIIHVYGVVFKMDPSGSFKKQVFYSSSGCFFSVSIVVLMTKHMLTSVTLVKVYRIVSFAGDIKYYIYTILPDTS